MSATGSETESTSETSTFDPARQEGDVARAERRKSQEPTRCSTCTGSLFVKLTREGDVLHRTTYCPECAAAIDVTSAAGRRAAFVAAAARELILGAA